MNHPAGGCKNDYEGKKNIPAAEMLKWDADINHITLMMLVMCDW